MIYIIHQVFKLCGGPTNEAPHLFAVAVVLLHVREVVCELLSDLLEALTKFSKCLADVLQID